MQFELNTVHNTSMSRKISMAQFLDVPRFMAKMAGMDPFSELGEQTLSSKLSTSPF